MKLRISATFKVKVADYDDWIDDDNLADEAIYQISDYLESLDLTGTIDDFDEEHEPCDFVITCYEVNDILYEEV